MTDHRPGPLAAALLQVLAPDAVVGDLYGDRGAEIYHAMTTGDDSELRELLRAARRTDGPILELACGSGRLTVPLSRLGREIVAVDTSRRMLQLLAERLGDDAATRVRPVQADMSALDLGEEFGLIVLATTSVTLLTEAQRAALFAAVRTHLALDGVFLISVHAEAAPAGAGESIIVPLPGDDGVVVLTEDVDHRHGHRDVSVVLLGRTPEDLSVEAFASRVQLLDEDRLRRELEAAGLRVQGATGVRLAAHARPVSMVECVR